MEIAIVLGLLVVAILLFSWEKIGVDVVTLFLLVILIITGILTPAEAFAGFGSDFIILLGAIFIISAALQETGILDLVGSRLLKMARLHPGFLITYIMAGVGFTSAFMNNTTVTAIFVAPVMAVARRLKVSPSKLLMPVAYASIVGGTCTIIGTSTNIAVNGYIDKAGLGGLGFFEILPVGIVLFVISLVYMALFSNKLLPDHKEESLTEEFHLKEFVSEVVITAKSPMIGQQIFQSNLSDMGFRILNVIRDGHNFLPGDYTIIKENDILIVEGFIDNLLQVKETAGIEIRADILLDKALQGEGIKLAEVLVTPQSDFVNTSLKNASFRQKFGLVVIAVNRTGYSFRDKLGSIILKTGDTLLVQGPAEKINFLKANRDIVIMDDFRPLLYKRRKGVLTLVVFIAAIFAGSNGWVPLSASLLLSALVVVVFKAVSLERAHEAIDWRLLILIGGMAAFGTAMTKTGAADWLSELIVQYMEPLGVLAIMAGFIILTVFLTQPMSNAAAALVVLPVAILTANNLGVSPKPFAVAVMLSASVSLITPFEPSCILVWGPGKYKFKDFFRAGFFLTIILMAVLLCMIPLIWPL
ncbi:MAG TPA: SLC13 family permease [Bacteroidia bacterium]|nr:SLC13 family permease [Bacteroidia bacterium]